MRAPRRWLRALALSAAALLAAPAAQAAAVHLADLVGTPTVTIDFETAPATLAAPVWLESGVLVSQANFGDALSDIWMASGFGTGQRSWFPNGGDFGWTRITRIDGSRFDAVAMLGGSGWLDGEGQQEIRFELRDNGGLVLEGSFDATFWGEVFSFSGGDFDEIRLRAHRGPLVSMDDCAPVANHRCNSFWFDDLQLGAADRTEVPEPDALALALMGLAALRAAAARRTREH